ncbi:uncharacterized protein LOC121736475 [Aricia agestis]|uniref:uncharacterized protein LOC121736475 n=1 Tax=Aricia agestis TaxID=91739 RepID=UPI001C2082DB|nr:uncharacterized protein LOC121736475 [Aricia agestis]
MASLVQELFWLVLSLLLSLRSCAACTRHTYVDCTQGDARCKRQKSNRRRRRRRKRKLWTREIHRNRTPYAMWQQVMCGTRVSVSVRTATVLRLLPSATPLQ